MFRQKKKIVLFIISIILLFSCICIPASAREVTDWNYDFNCQKPPVNSNSGYIEVVFENFSPHVFSFSGAWDSPGPMNTENVTYNASVVNNYLTISVNGSTEYSWVENGNRFYSTYHFFGCIQDISGSANFLNGSQSISFPLLNAGKIVAIRGYNCNVSGIASGICPAFNYGADKTIINKLDELVNTYRNSNQAIINNSTDNANKIQQNQDENTDKIINNQNQLQQQEKDETQNQGQDSINDVSGVIEDKSSGFISSITGLVSSMSYDGTKCAWTFPALKLPAIEGVMPEYQLTEEKPIDFEFWVNKIPENILLLIRSILTIALIVYCFKELYSTISYVLTLKGGGNDE